MKLGTGNGTANEMEESISEWMEVTMHRALKIIAKGIIIEARLSMEWIKVSMELAPASKEQAIGAMHQVRM